MEPIGAEAQDDCAKFWMLVEKCGEKGKSDAVKGQYFFGLFKRFSEFFLVFLSFS